MSGNIKPNSFTSYELTVKEQLLGSVLSSPQKLVIQNERAIVAEEKIALEYDPNNPGNYTQNEAYLRGKLDILSYLLELSDTAEAELANPEYKD